MASRKPVFRRGPTCVLPQCSTVIAAVWRFGYISRRRRCHAKHDLILSLQFCLSFKYAFRVAQSVYRLSYGLASTSVGKATNYGLDGSGIESRWGEIFPPVQTDPGAHLASCTMGTGSFPGVKLPGRAADHPPPSSAAVVEE